MKEGAKPVKITYSYSVVIFPAKELVESRFELMTNERINASDNILGNIIQVRRIFLPPQENA
ncbi:hypothetical protein [Xenorhabdus sp. IM139775]|uniref:hypothetical protein n=1 Tax=Xenorhabdus sp. IM139775 TaxID=3025876 RepID=UPI00235970C4|nr:hypothetical protein [Xenorhabdus sp. IM139775]